MYGTGLVELHKYREALGPLDEAIKVAAKTYNAAYPSIVATAKIEELIYQLRGKYTVVIVTHNMQQAARCSDYTAFMYLGRLVEYGPTNSIFLTPHLKETEAYVTGRFW